MRPGFTIPGIASAAAKKNHVLGSAHKFNAVSGRRAGLKSAITRRAKAKLKGNARVSS
jgi:hypothetical protein